MRAAFISLVVLINCSPALADGMFVWRKGADLNEPSQKAVILHKDGQEDLVLQVKYQGPAVDFCWIVPTPSRPEVAAVDGDLFEELSLYTQRRGKWGYRQADTADKDVEVIERKKVGVFDTTILEASDASKLLAWLKRNDYVFPDRQVHILEHYTSQPKPWVFTAMRVHAEDMNEDTAQKLREGTIQPIRLTFESKRTIYPLRISTVNAGQTEVLLYVFAETPMTHAWFEEGTAPHLWDFNDLTEEDLMYKSFFRRYRDQLFYRPVAAEELPRTAAALPRLQRTPMFLTKLRGRFCSAVMLDDVVLRPWESLPQHAQAATARQTFVQAARSIGAGMRHEFPDETGQRWNDLESWGEASRLEAPQRRFDLSLAALRHLHEPTADDLMLLVGDTHRWVRSEGADLSRADAARWIGAWVLGRPDLARGDREEAWRVILAPR